MAAKVSAFAIATAVALAAVAAADDITVFVDPADPASTALVRGLEADAEIKARHRVWPMDAKRHPWTARMNRVRRLPTVLIERNGVEVGRLVAPDPGAAVAAVRSGLK